MVYPSFAHLARTPPRCPFPQAMPAPRGFSVPEGAGSGVTDPYAVARERQLPGPPGAAAEAAVSAVFQPSPSATAAGTTPGAAAALQDYNSGYKDGFAAAAAVAARPAGQEGAGSGAGSGSCGGGGGGGGGVPVALVVGMERGGASEFPTATAVTDLNDDLGMPLKVLLFMSVTMRAQ